MFCTHCGKPVVGATPPGEAAVPASAPVAPAGSTSQTDGSVPSSSPIVPAKTASKGKNVAIIVAAVAAVAVLALAGGAFLYFGVVAPSETPRVAGHETDYSGWGDREVDDPSAGDGIGDLGDAEGALYDDVDMVLAGLRDPSSEVYQGFVDSFASAAGPVEGYGIDPAEFGALLLEGFDYEITDVVVDEDAGVGTVYVTADCKSVSTVLEESYAAIEEVAADPESQRMSEDQQRELVGKVFSQKAMDAPVRSVDLAFDYTYDAGEDVWNIDSSALGEIYDMFFE